MDHQGDCSSDGFSEDSVKIALEMMSDQFPQAKSVDPNEVIDTSFVKQAESGASR